MISITGKKWELLKINKNLLQKIKQDNNFSDIVSKLVLSRNFDKEETHLVNNKLDLPNVFSANQDFLDAVDLVINIINNNEKVCIVGDYDVDGSCATALLVRYFKSINHPHFFYIPDRVKDGYGATTRLFKKIILKKPKLIIMVDCGSTSIEAVKYLNKKKIKSLIIDHHEIDKPYPDSDVIINPKKDNEHKFYDNLCATTLTYFFIDLLIRKKPGVLKIRKFLIYVLLATVCDVMPLRKLNRLIYFNAIKEFNLSENYAFKELYKLNNKNNKININDLGYLIGPIINAGGRLGKSKYATELLSSDSHKIINNNSLKLIKLNKRRREIEDIILNEIDYGKIEEDNKDIIIYYKKNINEGLIGIIASRLKDYFNRPSIVITNSNELLKCSARSIYNYNIGRAIKNALHKNIIINGGGHNMAAGFTIKKDNLDLFKEFINNHYNKSKHITHKLFSYDAELSSTAINKSFYDDIKKLEPFGNGNPNPTFLFKDLKVIKTKILNKKHISLIFKSKFGYSINSISFNSYDNIMGEYLLNYKKNLHIIAQINENFWNNKNNLQLTISDIIL